MAKVPIKINQIILILTINGKIIKKLKNNQLFLKYNSCVKKNENKLERAANYSTYKLRIHISS